MTKLSLYQNAVKKYVCFCNYTYKYEHCADKLFLVCTITLVSFVDKEFRMTFKFDWILFQLNFHFILRSWLDDNRTREMDMCTFSDFSSRNENIILYPYIQNRMKKRYPRVR
jgi:hypothetical protein